MQKKWIIKAVNSGAAEDLSRTLGIHLITARILAGRGIGTSEEGIQFLTPALSALLDPFLLKGMQEAVDRLLLARKNAEKVCVYGDYDILLRNH